MSGVSPLCKDLPIGNVKGTPIYFVDEDHFGKWGNHGLVKRALLRHRCDVPMVYKALYWEERAGLSTVCCSHKAGYSVFVFFLVEVQQCEEFFKKRATSLSDKLFSRISRKYLGLASFSGSYGQNGLGDIFPTWRSSVGLSTKLRFFTDQQTPSLTSIDDQRLEEFAVWI